MDQSSTVDSVLFVVADSLRYDVLESLPTTRRLANENLDVPSFYTPGASTPSSMPGFIQSRSPLDHRGYGLNLPPDFPTLAEHLSKSDIECAGWHSNVYISEKYGYDRGFDRYHDLGGNDSDTMAADPTWRSVARQVTDSLGIRDAAEWIFTQFKRRGLADPNPKIRGERLVDECLDWLPKEADGKHRFGYLHLMDTHLPYLPPAQYRKKTKGAPSSPSLAYDLWQTLINNPRSLDDEDITSLQSLYMAEARYVDDQIERLVKELKNRGLWNSTALVFTADHGELFRDREVPGNDNVKHPDYLCDELTHTPLVFAGGPINKQTIETLTSGLDVGPTIAELFDLETPEEWQGIPIGSKDVAEREFVTSALAHAYGGGSGARVERSATHVAVRNDNVAVLWWLEEHPSEFYCRTNRGEYKVTPGSDIHFERGLQIAKEHGQTYTEVVENGETGNDVSERLRNLGYVE